MTESNPALRAPLTTGIPGLDTLLCGGFGRGRTYMLTGAPGAGKTIFANQVGFHRARQGERVLYVTLLAESHTDLVANLRSLSFFDPSLVPDTVTYLSAFSVLEEGGLESLLELIRKEVRLRGATFLVLDGLLAAEEVAPSPQLLKKFIHSLQVVTGIMGCTTLVLTTGGGGGLRAEHTMVDGLLLLKQRSFGVRTVRECSPCASSAGGRTCSGAMASRSPAMGCASIPGWRRCCSASPPRRSPRARSGGLLASPGWTT